MTLTFLNTPQKLIHPLTGETLIEAGILHKEKCAAIFSQENLFSPVINDPILGKLWEEDIRTYVDPKNEPWDGLIDYMINIACQFEGENPYLLVEFMEAEQILAFRNYPDVEPKLAKED